MLLLLFSSYHACSFLSRDNTTCKRWYWLEIPVNPTGLACRDPREADHAREKRKKFSEIFISESNERLALCGAHGAGNIVARRRILSEFEKTTQKYNWWNSSFFHNSRLCIELPACDFFFYFDQIWERSRERGTWGIDEIEAEIWYNEICSAAFTVQLLFFVTHIHSDTVNHGAAATATQLIKAHI